METSTATGQAMPAMRQLLIEAAQQEIFDRGYHGASLRGIARRAEVDPSLVRHYFGSKEKLLLQAVQVRVDPQEFAAEILRGTPGGIGRRIVKFMLGFWEDPASAKSLVRLSATLNSVEIADLTRESFIRPFFGTIAREVSPDHPELRASLAASQMLSLAFSRYLLTEPALAEANHQDLVRIVGRSVQRYLTEPLDPEPAGQSAA